MRAVFDTPPLGEDEDNPLNDRQDSHNDEYDPQKATLRSVAVAFIPVACKTHGGDEQHEDGEWLMEVCDDV